jgi:hypothetical protein
MTILWYLLFWLAFIPVAYLNGGLREFGYRRWLGELPAQQLSTLIGCALFWVTAWLFARKVPLESKSDALVISLTWLVLTFAFEAFMIVVLMKKPWAEVWAAYDVTGGRVWVVALAWVALLPFMIMKNGGN